MPVTELSGKTACATPEKMIRIGPGRRKKMTERNRMSDLRGVTGLAKDAVIGLADIVEAMHKSIGQRPAILGGPVPGKTRGITGFVYRSIRTITSLTGRGLDAVLEQMLPLVKDSSASPDKEAVLSALNGVLGDYLAEKGNPLAISMSFRVKGIRLDLGQKIPADLIANAGSRILICVHGLCMNDLQWNQEGHDHGSALASDLSYSPVYLRYNSGRHISENGRDFASLLESLLSAWPVDVTELTLLGHSMGGLVIRSALHYGAESRQSWIQKVKKVIFLGTPHYGAPMEKGGNWLHLLLGVSPYTIPFARLARIRSAGITDLRHGNVVDEDWAGTDRFGHNDDRRKPVPLPSGVSCYAIAVSSAEKESELKTAIVGDGLVLVDSALGRHKDPDLTLKFPSENIWLGYGINHFRLLGDATVYEKIRQWLD